jgi:predicted dehydrogenase
MKSPQTRREFLQRNLAATLGAACLPNLVPSSVLGAQGHAAPNSRVNVAGIGVGPQGRGVMGGFLGQPDVRVVAVCDVAELNLKAALNQVNGHYQNQDCQTHHDYREVLQRKDIDAVLIATPDHWHVPIALAAAKAKKDMYLEKPMGLSVEEDQMLRKLCQKNKVIFQFGTQQRSSREFRKACELVLNGKIGRLKQINVWCSASRPGGSTRPAPAPEGLDYDFWLGPAPHKPYTDGKAFDGIPAGTWKTWWFNYDYALGFIAGWGVHPLDIAYWGHPQMMKGVAEIEGRGVIPKEGACDTSVAWEVFFQFADGVRLRYRGTPNGYNEKTDLTDFADWRGRYGTIHDHGTAFEGEKGWVHVYRGGVFTSPEKLVEEPLGPNDTPLPTSSGHQRNLVECIRSRKPAICPIEDAVQADLLCHLSDIAIRASRKLRWDPAKEKFVGDADANKRLALRPIRKPWKMG